MGANTITDYDKAYILAKSFKRVSFRRMRSIFHINGTFHIKTNYTKKL